MDDPDLAALVARRPAALIGVTWLRPASSPGAAARLTFADGSIAKARRLASAAAAEQLSRLAGHAPPGSIARVLDREGAVLLEEWVGGAGLGEAAEDPAVLARAGALLASFAAVGFPPELGTRRRAVRLDKLERLLAGLVSALAIAEPLAARLLACARATMPATAEAGLIHLDFAPENLVVLASGELCAIDNESLSVGAHDFDLARALCRWPMSAAGRAAFLAGYRRHRSPSAFLAHEAYWSILSLAASLRFAVAERPHGVAGLTERLRAMVPRDAPAS